MSKEREDKLQDLATYGVSFSKRGQRIDPRDVYISTEPEQEPVAWLHEWVDEYGEPVKRVVCNFYEGLNLIPLYTAPPKREQLSDGELAVWYSQHTWAMDKQEYIWGFKDAEKCHGIGGEEE